MPCRDLSYPGWYRLRHKGLGRCVVPVALPRRNGDLVPLELVLEEVEDGKLVPRHGVRVRLALDLGPDLGQGGIEDAVHSGILRAVIAFAGDL